MINAKVYPVEKSKLASFKKSLVKKIEENLDDYEAFKMKNKDDYEYILLKKNSIQYKMLTNLLKVNKPIYLSDLEKKQIKTFRI